MTRFKIGDIVRIKADVLKKRGDRRKPKIARIKTFYDDIQGGVILDRFIHDFRSWNVEDLEKGDRP